MSLKQSFLTRVDVNNDDNLLMYLNNLMQHRGCEDLSGVLAAIDFMSEFNKDVESFSKALLALGVQFDVDILTLTVLVLYPGYKLGLYQSEDLSSSFSETVIDVLNKSAGLNTLEESWRANISQEQTEIIRRLFLSTVNDLRIIIVRLVVQVYLMHNLHKVDNVDEIALLSKELYAPLANRLGFYQIKWQLEDLSFRHMMPIQYNKIALAINEPRSKRQEFLDKILQDLSSDLNHIGKFKIDGRVKHFYSIYNKSIQKKLGVEKVYDALAVRVIVNNIDQCYSVLGAINAKHNMLESEFDDYIASPKANGYKSIHTAIELNCGRVIEIQIRTAEMHDFAESGFASHWLYKEGGNKSANFKDKALWLKQLVSWHDESQAVNYFKDRVFVFTPKGEVKDLAAGSTVLDFAYSIHTQVGHRCKGAKVNDKIAPLGTLLQTSDQVHIITGKQEEPRLDWLKMVFCASSKAKINQWFRRQGHDGLLSRGKILLLHAVKEPLSMESLLCVAKQLNFKDIDHLFLALARNEIMPQTVVKRLHDLHQNQPTETIKKPVNIKPTDPPVVVEGFSGVLVNLAQCCSPLPGEGIIGRVTKMRGVVVHRKNCLHVENIVDNVGFINVCWVDEGKGKLVTAKIQILLSDKLGDKNVQNWFANNRVVWSNWQSHWVHNKAEIILELNIHIASVIELKKCLQNLLAIEGVVEVRRL